MKGCEMNAKDMHANLKFRMAVYVACNAPKNQVILEIKVTSLT
jgi:hypothetical protein